jgi:tRNA(fMet)-specific endonuclease VapC
MLQWLLDTNLCVRALRDRPIGIRDRLKAEFDSVCISSVVRYELYVSIIGAGDVAKKRDEIDEFLSPFPCLALNDDAAFHAADIRVDLTGKGQLIGPYDMLIAGHARSLDLTVITGNLKEFTRVEGLRCEDWL